MQIMKLLLFIKIIIQGAVGSVLTLLLHGGYFASVLIDKIQQPTNMLLTLVKTQVLQEHKTAQGNSRW